MRILSENFHPGMWTQDIPRASWLTKLALSPNFRSHWENPSQENEVESNWRKFPTSAPGLCTSILAWAHICFIDVNTDTHKCLYIHSVSTLWLHTCQKKKTESRKLERSAAVSPAMIGWWKMKKCSIFLKSKGIGWSPVWVTGICLWKALSLCTHSLTKVLWTI